MTQTTKHTTRQLTSTRGNAPWRAAAPRLALALLALLCCHAAAHAQSSPTGPAGGDLSGTYPNPTLASDRVKTAGDTMTGALDITLPHAGTVVTPFRLAAVGNFAAGRGLALEFRVPTGGASAAGGQITSAWDSAGRTYLGFSAYNGTAVSEVLRVSGTGNVGIGTINPTSRLQVASGADSLATLLHLEPGATAKGGAAFAVSYNPDGAETGFDLSVRRGTPYISRFGVSQDGHVYLQPGGAGSVGIGTTAPIAKLQIGQTTAAVSALTGGVIRGQYLSYNSGAGGYAGGITLENTYTSGPVAGSGVVMHSNDGAPLAAGDRLGFSVFGGSVSDSAVVNSAAVVAYADGPWAVGDAPARLEFELAPAGSTTRAKVLTVKSNGNVGVGTTGPAYRLDVQGGAVNASGGLCIAGSCKDSWAEVNQWATSGAGISFSGGPVGVGTAAPSSGLEVQAAHAPLTLSQAGVAAKVTLQASSGTNLQLSANAKYTGAWDRFDAAEPSWNLVLAPTADFMGVRRAAPGGAFAWADLLRITSDGKVGLGTAAPGSNLHLNVPGSASPVGAMSIDVATFATSANAAASYFFRVRDIGGSSTPFYVRGNGNVGVGTTDPDSRLSVQGDIHISGSNRLYFQSGAADPNYFVESFIFDNAAAMRVMGWRGVRLAASGGDVLTAETGKVTVTGALTVTGAISGGSIEAKYQDVAEWVPSSQRLAAGTVVVLDTERSNQVLASASAYDTKVAGVVSARPGIALGEAGAGKVLVATTGRVKVRADAAAAPIRIGDLLVTSGVEGVAMKSVPLDFGGTPVHRPGTIIGKALEPLEKGTGEILVLLSLQ